MTRISFVIPVYRNQHAVTMTYQQIRQVLASDLPAYDYEFVFVDDGSDDGSLDELIAIRRSDERVHVVSFTRNFGQMAAILAGFKQATGDLVLHLSADLQDPVSLIPRMVKEVEVGSEVVVAHREHRADRLSSRVSSKIFYAIIRLSLPNIPPGGFDYVLMTRRVAEPTSKSTNGWLARSRGATRRRRARGWPGGVTTSSSSRMTGTVTRSDSSIGSVNSPASTRPARISCTECSAVATRSRTSSWG